MSARQYLRRLSVVLLLAVMGAPSPWQQVRAAVRARSSIELLEDFSPDLRHWAGPAGLPGGWSTDSSGFSHPGNLAIYINSVPLAGSSLQLVITALPALSARRE